MTENQNTENVTEIVEETVENSIPEITETVETTIENSAIQSVDEINQSVGLSSGMKNFAKGALVATGVVYLANLTYKGVIKLKNFINKKKAEKNKNCEDCSEESRDEVENGSEE